MTPPAGIKKISETLWEIPKSYKPGMLVPARIYATEKLLSTMDDGVFEQITNVATLQGIVAPAICMPDGHQGYGFPIGGVAAIDPKTGVISPGGIGFDINCGMRLLATNLTEEEVKPQIKRLVDRLFKHVPSGVGSRGMLSLSTSDFIEVLHRGARWCVTKGYGREEDLEKTEEKGCVNGANADTVSKKAMERGLKQIGTLGSGNHYLEIQVARPENIADPACAETFGITLPRQVVVMFHCGSRGFGHQVASDYLRQFLSIMTPKHRLTVPDRELACAPFASDEGQAYFAAMNCAINMAFANRQMIAHRIREVFAEIFKRDPDDLGMNQIYDISHNTAKLENHYVKGELRSLLVHRKGATRSLAPGAADLPEAYKKAGQPVIIGGSMETGSYLLACIEKSAASFFSTAHGSGRTMSRAKARKKFRGQDLQRKMLEQGIYSRTSSYAGLAEEAGHAYKDIDEVVLTTDLAGLSKPVARLTPIGNVK